MWSYSWLQRLFAKSFNVLAIDHRGVGGTRHRVEHMEKEGSTLRPLDIADITLDKMAADVHHLLTHLQIPSVVLVGFSFGFFIAQTFVQKYNEHSGKKRVKGIVIYDSSPAPINTNTHQLGFADSAGILGLMQVVQTDNEVLSNFDETFRGVLWGSGGCPDTRYSEMWQASLHQSHPHFHCTPFSLKQHLIAQFLCCATFEAVGELAKYKFKVLACMAKDGAFADENHYRAIAEYIRNANPANPPPQFFKSGHEIAHFCEVALAAKIATFAGSVE